MAFHPIVGNSTEEELEKTGKLESLAVEVAFHPILNEVPKEIPELMGKPVEAVASVLFHPYILEELNKAGRDVQGLAGTVTEPPPHTSDQDVKFPVVLLLAVVADALGNIPKSGDVTFEGALNTIFWLVLFLRIWGMSLAHQTGKQMSPRAMSKPHPPPKSSQRQIQGGNREPRYL